MGTMTVNEPVEIPSPISTSVTPGTSIGSQSVAAREACLDLANRTVLTSAFPVIYNAPCMAPPDGSGDVGFTGNTE